LWRCAPLGWRESIAQTVIELLQSEP